MLKSRLKCCPASENDLAVSCCGSTLAKLDRVWRFESLDDTERDRERLSGDETVGMGGISTSEVSRNGSRTSVLAEEDSASPQMHHQPAGSGLPVILGGVGRGAPFPWPGL